jgi:hypothetical protein
MTRKLAVHLYWMWRQAWDYKEFEPFGDFSSIVSGSEEKDRVNAIASAGSYC